MNHGSLLLMLLLALLGHATCRAQSCRSLYQQANALVERGLLEKARERYRQVIECGDNLYVPDSERRIAWINRLLRKGDAQKPFALSDTEVVIPCQGGQDVVTVDDPTAWSAAVSPEGAAWCRATRGRGKLHIVCAANASPVARRCTVTVRMGSTRHRVTVRSEAAPPSLSISVDSLALPGSGGSTTVEVRSNLPWAVADAPQWVSVSRAATALRLRVAANDASLSREATVRVTADTLSATIAIRQSAGLDSLALSKPSLHFGPEGGGEYVNVYTGAAAWSTSAVPSWCQVERIADRLLLVRCAPATTDGLSREGSVSVATGTRAIALAIAQEARPLVAVVPRSAVGGRALSLGVTAGYLLPVVSASSEGDVTGSVVDYGNGTSGEQASYSSAGGFNISAYADIRLRRNFYIMAGLGLSRYTYHNTYNVTAERNELWAITTVYARGTVRDRYEERYAHTQGEASVLASFRFPLSPVSHLRLNAGPVLYYGLSATMTLHGTSDAERMTAYIKNGSTLTLQPSPDYTAQPLHTAGHARFNLYDDYVDYGVTFVEQESRPFDHSQFVSHAPLRRLAGALRLGLAYEHRGLAVAVDYDVMLSNMAESNYWNASRWAIFGYASAPMQTYRQRIHQLRVSLAYTLRY